MIVDYVTIFNIQLSKLAARALFITVAMLILCDELY